MNLNDLELFLVKCAGGDLETLHKDKVPIEYNKLVGIGGTVFLTGLYAGFAMAYAASWVFNDKITLFLLSLFWGLAIFNLDRLIVGTTYKKKTIQSADFFQLVFRAILTIIIAFTISIPLEIKFFNKELNERIDNNRKNDVYDNPELTKIKQEKEKYDILYLKEINEGLGGRPKTSGRVSQEWKENAKTEEKKYNSKLKKLQEDAADKPIGFLLLFKALEEYKKEDAYVRKIALAITLLLIFFELTPVLIKFTLPMGNYDERIGYLIAKGRIRMRFNIEKFILKRPFKNAKIPYLVINTPIDVDPFNAEPLSSTLNSTSKKGNSNRYRQVTETVIDYLKGKMVDICIALLTGLVLSIFYDNIHIPTLAGIVSWFSSAYLISENSKNT